MSPRTRTWRVGWLSFGQIVLVSAAIAGPAKVTLDRNDETDLHGSEAIAQVQAPTLGADTGRSIVDSQPASNTAWLEYDPPESSPQAARSFVASGGFRSPVLSVPVLPLGVLGLAGMASGMIYLGSRLAGLRK